MADWTCVHMSSSRQTTAPNVYSSLSLWYSFLHLISSTINSTATAIQSPPSQMIILRWDGAGSKMADWTCVHMSSSRQTTAPNVYSSLSLFDTPFCIFFQVQLTQQLRLSKVHQAKKQTTCSQKCYVRPGNGCGVVCAWVCQKAGTTVRHLTVIWYPPLSWLCLKYLYLHTCMYCSWSTCTCTSFSWETNICE